FWLFLFFGLPLSYLGSAALAFPMYRFLQSRRALRPATIVGSAAACGACWVMLAMLVMGGLPASTDTQFVIGAVSLGALAGGVAGLTFLALGGVGNRHRDRAS